MSIRHAMQKMEQVEDLARRFTDPENVQELTEAARNVVDACNRIAATAPRALRRAFVQPAPAPPESEVDVPSTDESDPEGTP